MADKKLTMMVSTYYERQGALDCKWEEEADLLANCTECCKMLGALPIRMAYTTKNGQSDLLICYEGRFYAAELKARNGTPSPQQLKFIEKVEAAGGKGAVVYTLRDLFRLLTQ